MSAPVAPGDLIVLGAIFTAAGLGLAAHALNRRKGSRADVIDVAFVLLLLGIAATATALIHR